jgi:hypothetical protein
MKLKYFGTTLGNQCYLHGQTKSKINSENVCQLLSKNVESGIYKAVVLHVVRTVVLDSHVIDKTYIYS